MFLNFIKSDSLSPKSWAQTWFVFPEEQKIKGIFAFLVTLALA
jgi:hypothetical protein